MRIFKQAFESIQGKKPEEENRSSKGSFYIDEQFMTPEFLYKQGQNQTQQGMQQKKLNLTKQFFIALSTMEHKFNSSPIKQINMVDQLVGMYQECVQQYDTLMDPIKYYFIDKIRTIVQQSDKFTQREPKSQQSSEKKIQQMIPSHNEVSYFKDFEDFTDRIDKPTEYATPKAEEQFQQNDNKLVQQLQSLIEEGDTKVSKEIILKHHESPKVQIKNQQDINNQPHHDSPKPICQKVPTHIDYLEEVGHNVKPQVEAMKKSPKVEFRSANNETPVAHLLLSDPKKEEEPQNTVVEAQLQTQQKSIQDRLLARQRSSKKKDI